MTERSKVTTKSMPAVGRAPSGGLTAVGREFYKLAAKGPARPSEENVGDEVCF
jgi:hypothetical protein